MTRKLKKLSTPATAIEKVLIAKFDKEVGRDQISGLGFLDHKHPRLYHTRFGTNKELNRRLAKGLIPKSPEYARVAFLRGEEKGYFHSEFTSGKIEVIVDFDNHFPVHVDSTLFREAADEVFRNIFGFDTFKSVSTNGKGLHFYIQVDVSKVSRGTWRSKKLREEAAQFRKTLNRLQNVIRRYVGCRALPFSSVDILGKPSLYGFNQSFQLLKRGDWVRWPVIDSMNKFCEFQNRLKIKLETLNDIVDRLEEDLKPVKVKSKTGSVDTPFPDDLSQGAIEWFSRYANISSGQTIPLNTTRGRKAAISPEEFRDYALVILRSSQIAQGSKGRQTDELKDTLPRELVRSIWQKSNNEGHLLGQRMWNAHKYTFVRNLLETFGMIKVIDPVYRIPVFRVIEGLKVCEKQGIAAKWCVIEEQMGAIFSPHRETHTRMCVIRFQFERHVNQAATLFRTLEDHIRLIEKQFEAEIGCLAG